MNNVITCSRCNYQGQIKKLRIKRLEQEVPVCEECDALWLTPLREEPVYGVDFIDFKSFLEGQGVKYDASEWEPVDAGSASKI
ncbi:hypothetical protein [Noviherbaspirillum massiliense]|uniref:hypothetical protein n=1 Tax=Noviherbaspirillum massiliense TaxID=1465823 RepID=UPI0003761F4E|nr:hypothetical protein [Noviherbaspirillum massiliense]